MNREIKFRVWDNGKYSWGWITEYVEYPIINGEICFDDNFVVCQYTGIKDKKGNEIYEGDIIKILERDWMSGSGDPKEHMEKLSSLAEVEFLNGCFLLRTITIKNYFLEELGANIHRRDIFEVVGNRFENPELLTTNP